MHRLPLKLKTPSYAWDRSVKDYEFVANALNNDNYQEMFNCILQIELEQRVYEIEEEIKAVGSYNKALYFLDRSMYTEALVLLNKVVLYAPKDGSALEHALRLRGDVFYKQNRFESSTSDFEFLLQLKNHVVEELSLVYAKLIIGYFMLGKFDKAIDIYRLLEKMIPKRRFSTVYLDPFAPDAVKVIYTAVRLYYQMEGHNCTPDPFRRKPEHTAYSLLTSHDDNTVDGLYFKDNYLKNTVVLCEKPVTKYFTMPWIQCEVCLDMTHQMYSCFDCHIKTYCSLSCMKSDILHKEECKGMKYLLVIMLNCQNLFRSFVELIYLIQRHLVGRFSFAELRKAGDIVTALRTHAKESNVPLLKLLAEEADYKNIDDKTFSTILASSVRLSIFISEKTELMRGLEPGIETSREEERIVIASLLLQLQYHLEKQALKIVYDIPIRSQTTYGDPRDLLEDAAYETIITPKHGQDATSYFSIQEESISKKMKRALDFTIKHPPPRVPPSPDRDKTTLRRVKQLVTYALDYSDLVTKSILHHSFHGVYSASEYAISRFLSTMDESDKIRFIKQYIELFNRNIFYYFYDKKLSKDKKAIAQILHATCYDTRKFRHSCDPNVEILIMDNGMLYVKTIKPVAKGEECFISYKCRYYDNDNDARQRILKDYNVKCQCEYCLMPKTKEPLALYTKIYCIKCKAEFSPIEDVCPVCGIKYEKLMEEYGKKIRWLNANTFVDDDAPEAIEYFIVQDRFYALIFPPYNQQRMEFTLKHAKCLTLNNFVTQAIEVTKNVYDTLKRYYVERKILFTYYHDILEIWAILIHYNLDKGHNNATPYQLREITFLGIDLINLQIAHLRTFGIYGKLCAPYLANLRLFMEWRDAIPVVNTIQKEFEEIVPIKHKMPELKSCST